MSDRDVTHSDLVEIAKRNGDFRKNYGVLVGAISALDKCSAASIILVASLVVSSRGCVWILVAMNNIGDSARGMNRWSVISLVIEAINRLAAVVRYMDLHRCARP